MLRLTRSRSSAASAKPSLSTNMVCSALGRAISLGPSSSVSEPSPASKSTDLRTARPRDSSPAPFGKDDDEVEDGGSNEKRVRLPPAGLRPAAAEADPLSSAKPERSLGVPPSPSRFAAF